MTQLKTGDYVRLGGPSVLSGEQAVVLADLGEEVYVVSTMPARGSRQKLCRSTVPRDDVKPWRATDG